MKKILALSLLFFDHLYSNTLRIHEQTDADRALVCQMKPLFAEKRNTGAWDLITKGLFNYEGNGDSNLDVQRLCCKPPHNARVVNFTTQDSYQLAGLYFKRDNAPLNIVYASGFFRGLTPTKEWIAPLSILFPECTILSYDWREYGESEKKGKTFDQQASWDIQAAVEWIRKQNDKPVVLVGFCLGAALAVRATLVAQILNLPMADAVVLNCMPADVRDMKERIVQGLPTGLRQICSRSCIQNNLFEWLTGDVFNLKPESMLEHITIPIYFEHLSNNFATPLGDLERNVAVCRSKRMMMVSDIGKHVRIHTKAPQQYREAFSKFVREVALLKEKPKEHDFFCSDTDDVNSPKKAA